MVLIGFKFHIDCIFCINNFELYIIAQFNREVKIECIFDIRNGAWIFKVTMTCINELENQFNLLGIYYN